MTADLCRRTAIPGPMSWQRQRQRRYCGWTDEILLAKKRRPAFTENLKRGPSKTQKQDDSPSTPPAETVLEPEKQERYDTSVPMRTVNEWVLWSFLESKFGDDTKFSVVVSWRGSGCWWGGDANWTQQRRGNLQISTPSPLSAGEILKKCRL